MKHTKIFSRLLLAGAMALVPMVTFSASVLVVQLKNGDTEKYILEHKPQLTFDGNGVQITSEAVSTSATYTYAQIEKFYFDVTSNDDTKPTPDGIDELETEKAGTSHFVFRYDGREAFIGGVEGVGEVAVFTMNGLRVRPVVRKASEGVYVNLSQLPAAIYLIHAGERTFKVIKK